VVVGRLRQRSFELAEGDKRTVIELHADEVGISLRFATAQVTKATRGHSGEERSPGNAAEDDEPPF
jgi:single-strand DNA-binding protein